MCALAECGQAPKILAYIDRKGRPLSAVAISMFLGFIAYINCAKVGPEVFNWLLALSGLSSFFHLGFDLRMPYNVSMGMESTRSYIE